MDIFHQSSAFPPNYIHSLDSSHMMMTALRCSQLGEPRPPAAGHHASARAPVGLRGTAALLARPGSAPWFKMGSLERSSAEPLCSESCKVDQAQAGSLG